MLLHYSTTFMLKVSFLSFLRLSWLAVGAKLFQAPRGTRSVEPLPSYLVAFRFLEADRHYTTTFWLAAVGSTAQNNIWHWDQLSYAKTESS